MKRKKLGQISSKFIIIFKVLGLIFSARSPTSNLHFGSTKYGCKKERKKEPCSC